ncbi:hypothetical protein GCM10011529_31490 [Polymorphobacter glacialis]|uniref:Uncharacterized protein n=2 Tax=Sandarakinorhabdus glacialis TaxID=1614636 RepID=A0A917EDE5_9SPHN|nr:hypothetical protein GCM10011529_31490 [Polymorphobacter glacialis]
MEDLSIAIAKVEAKLDAVSTPAKRAEKQRRANLGKPPAHLERIEQVIDICSKQCACCGGAAGCVSPRKDTYYWAVFSAVRSKEA